ncbi:hypothetical protein PY650_12970 [Rhizobium calliandrae]|uniref:Uncharacterized protein n=1 Tax=Rhizobium calliandrae TaxID=1312182 RepID=A0ABT7KD73_9HYPH|nr:hypothetical protein [Rhizobium calliandrae]MDL2406557.1 hypothetical protein [Rhizobium calliandrae]
MLDTHSPNLTKSIRFLVRDTDQRHHRNPASAPSGGVHRKRRLRNRKIRERRTFYAMFAFGLVLGGLELFIVLHYL